MRRSNPRIFLKRKTKTHFEKYFLTGPECFTSFVFYVFYTTSKAKTNWGKSNFPFKNVSAWCSTKSKLQTGFEKENTPLMSFMAVFGGVSVYFVGRRLTLPRMQNCSFYVQRFFRAAFHNQLQQPGREIIFMQVFCRKDTYFSMYAQT